MLYKYESEWACLLGDVMFRIPFLRNLFILALVATCCLPLYTLYVLHPSYHRQLIHEIEEESARFASYLVRSLGM